MGKALDTEPEDLSPLSKNFRLYGRSPVLSIQQVTAGRRLQLRQESEGVSFDSYEQLQNIIIYLPFWTQGYVLTVQKDVRFIKEIYVILIRAEWNGLCLN